MKASLVELSLHSLILEGDSLALSKLYDKYGDRVTALLSARYPKIATKDEALIFAAVNEAFFGYHRNPTTFDPEKNTLQRFLEVAAERDLINILSKEAKQGKKENLPDDVELEVNFWNSIKKDQHGPENEMIAKETFELVAKEIANHFTSVTDRAMAVMIISGERETSAYVDVLQIQELTPQEQKNKVKKVKDRIKKVLDRKDVEDKIKDLLK
jgi:hypothetical protein